MKEDFKGEALPLKVKEKGKDQAKKLDKKKSGRKVSKNTRLS